MTDDHDELLASAAAWVLGALPEDEAGAFEEHLRGCERCREEVASLQSVADALPLAAPPADPPPELKGRIMAVVEREAELLRAAGPEADHPPRRRWWGWMAARPAFAGACAAVLIGIGVVVGVFGVGGGGPQTVTRTATVADRLSGSGELVQRGSTAILRVRAMPAPPPGHVYEAWVLRGSGAPAPAGVFTVDRAGRGSVALRGDVRGAAAVLVTTEPAGGTGKPTSAPIVRVVPA